MSTLKIIRERFSHMGNHSGYDMLFESIEKQIYCKGLWRGKWKPNHSFIRSKLIKLYPNKNISPFYSHDSFWTEIEALKANPFKSNIIHVLYGENNFNLLGRISLRNKVVVTFHQPIEWWVKTGVPLKVFFKNIDHIIVLSNSEKKSFEEYATGKVSFIPHGIDTEFFKEPKVNSDSSSEKLICVTVGHWFRDFNTLQQIINCFKENKNIEFHIVIPDAKIEANPQKSALKKILDCKNTHWHNGISDVKLRDLYLASNLLLLPLKKATANNAILEAMSCGLPILSNNVGGIKDYTDNSFTELFEIGDVKGFTNHLTSLLLKTDKIKLRGQKARKFAEENFSWNTIAQKTIAIYNQL